MGNASVAAGNVSGYIRTDVREGPAVDAWIIQLHRGDLDAAWDRFVGRYRRLIFAAIRHYAQDYDDVMDVFAQVCQALREDRMGRVRTYIDATEHRAKFTTWLMTVVQHLTVDWFRHRDGRRRLSAVAENLPPLRRAIFEHVFLNQRSHVEAYELIHCRDAPTLSFHQFILELRATYQTVTHGRRGEVLRDLGHVPLPPEVASVDPIGPSQIEIGEQSELVERALCVLAPEDRLLIELYVVEELPAETVAQVLGLANPKAVYNRAYRATAVVREQLERSGIHRGNL